MLGSGNGGCAAAFDFASHGHEVSLVDFASFPEQIEAIAANGGIRSDGDLKGFAPIAYSGHDFERALRGAGLIFAVGPAFSTEPFGAACRPFLARRPDGDRVPELLRRRARVQARRRPRRARHIVKVADTSTLPYAVRVVEPGRHPRVPQAQGGPVAGRRAGERDAGGRCAIGGRHLPRHDRRRERPLHGAGEREPGHPPGRDPRQCRPDRTQQRRSALLRGRARPRRWRASSRPSTGSGARWERAWG